MTVDVPWSVLPDYRCFGCSPSNEHGLRLTFTRHGDDGLACDLEFTRTFESYPGIVHGGMSTTACDEIMGNLLVLRTGHSALTTSLRTRYIAPLRVGTRYRCTARTDVTGTDPGPWTAHAEILDPHGDPVVYATGSYQPITPEAARTRMDITDHEAAIIEAALSDLRTRPR